MHVFCFIGIYTDTFLHTYMCAYVYIHNVNRFYKVHELWAGLYLWAYKCLFRINFRKISAW